MSGQVNRGSFLGDNLEALGQNPKFKSYVDIGTWNGEGSTKCLMDGILTRQDDSRVVSVEANIEFYEQACAYWAPFLVPHLQSRPGKLPRLELLYGRLIEKEELLSVDEIREHPRFNDAPWLEWRERNSAEYEVCPNVIDSIPTQIDVLCLDGGQFSTYAEFQKLKDRTKIVLLDDTDTYKTEKIRSEIIASPDMWTVLFDYPRDRHGCMMACKNYPELKRDLDLMTQPTP